MVKALPINLIKRNSFNQAILLILGALIFMAGLYGMFVALFQSEAAWQFLMIIPYSWIALIGAYTADFAIYKSQKLTCKFCKNSQWHLPQRIIKSRVFKCRVCKIKEKVRFVKK